MTLNEIGKMNALGPHTCLADVLNCIHDHKINRLTELLPWSLTPVAQLQSEAA